MRLVLMFFIGMCAVAMLEGAAQRVPMTPQQERATAAIREYFRRTTARLEGRALANLDTREEWEKQRPQLRAEILEMLGLCPLPEKTDLKPVVTGTVEHDDFVVEKLHFQSRPGLYVTANFYRPRQVSGQLPTILYVCGHSRVFLDGVAYGSKTAYQHHPVWFVRHGYCALIIDTLQLGEIEGIHHGTSREGMWWWLDRGYTSAGVEAWNCVRALDYLETRPEVDMKRIGVTGRSGGGAYTWWLAALDDRPACLVPVAGITDMQNHVVDDCIEGHCDCMFMVNTYQWDFATLAALAAPRPMLISNSDKDTIFPLEGVTRTHEKARRIYRLYGATDRLGLLITEGPHRDTQELQVPAFRWMNRWLKQQDEPITRAADKPLEPKQLKVFDRLPEDQRNTKIHESFVPKAEAPEIPTDRAHADTLKDRMMAELKDKCFRAWPKDPAPVADSLTHDRESQGLQLRIIEYTSEENLRFPIYVISGTRKPTPGLVIVKALDEDGWDKWLTIFGAAFPEMKGDSAGTPDAEALAAHIRLLNAEAWAFAAVPPRGVGPNRWDPEPRENTHILRRFVLLGQTADSGRVWDVRRAIQALRQRSPYREATLWVQGDGVAAGIALYAGLFEPAVERFDLHRLPVSHRDGPHFLNVLRVLDLPQAVALAFPRPVVLHDVKEQAWEWPQQAAGAYEPPPLQFRKTKE